MTNCPTVVFRHRRALHRYALLALLLPALPLTAQEQAKTVWVFSVTEATIGVSVLAFIIGGLVGYVLGTTVFREFLRLADDAASQFHRAEVAKIFCASSTIHSYVQQILRVAHERIAELRREIDKWRGGPK